MKLFYKVFFDHLLLCQFVTKHFSSDATNMYPPIYAGGKVGLTMVVYYWSEIELN